MYARHIEVGGYVIDRGSCVQFDFRSMDHDCDQRLSERRTGAIIGGRGSQRSCEGLNTNRNRP